MEVSRKKIQSSSLTFHTRNALARDVRTRWRTNTLGHIQEEWDLSDHEARSVLYATASLTTIERIYDHPNGGVKLALHLLCIRFQTSLEEIATAWEREEEHERQLQDARVQRQGRALRSLESRRGVGPEDRA